MARHTPPRPVAVEELFPELAPLRRDAIRLHPRPGDPSPKDSSVGGPLLWPTTDPWPICTEEHCDLEGRRHDAATLVPVVQVYQTDAPGMPFPQGTDLLQVLWCPFAHSAFEPLPRVYWRDSASVGQIADTPAAPADSPEDYTPDPCVVHPERVTEYPDQDLPKEGRDDLEYRFARLAEETGWAYDAHLAAAPGTKLGGYPSWVQDPAWPTCATCGQRMHHLLTVASWESDGQTWRTWMPVEDRELLKGQEDLQTELWRSVGQAAGLMLGDVGDVYIFECPSCPGRPTSHLLQCS